MYDRSVSPVSVTPSCRYVGTCPLFTCLRHLARRLLNQTCTNGFNTLNVVIDCQTLSHNCNCRVFGGNQMEGEERERDDRRTEGNLSVMGKCVKEASIVRQEKVH